jgi:hypothetical protein
LISTFDTIIKSADAKAGSQLVTVISRGLAAVGRHAEILQLLKRPELTTTHKLDFATYEMLLKLAPSENTVEFIDAVLEHLDDSKQHPDQRLDTAIVSACMRTNDLESALAIAEEMLEKDEADPLREIRTMTVLLNLATRSKEEAMGRQIIKLVEKNRILRDVSFVYEQVSFLSSIGSFEDMFRALSYMIESNMNISSDVYQGIVNNLTAQKSNILLMRNVFDRLVSFTQKKQLQLDAASQEVFAQARIALGSSSA